MNACTTGDRRPLCAWALGLFRAILLVALTAPGNLALGQGSGGLGLAIPNPDFPLSAGGKYARQQFVLCPDRPPFCDSSAG